MPNAMPAQADELQQKVMKSFRQRKTIISESYVVISKEKN
jgi:hypothetical protein